MPIKNRCQTHTHKLEHPEGAKDQQDSKSQHSRTGRAREGNEDALKGNKNDVYSFKTL